MLITIKHSSSDSSSEKIVSLEDIESFSSNLKFDGSKPKLSFQMKDRADSREFLSFSEILVHDEDGSVRYEEVLDLAHLTELIDREKRYYARKKLF